MKAESNSVVSFNYHLTCEGSPVESSPEPMAILLGAGNIIPGLESAMTGREVGERFDVRVTPDQAYGEHREDWVQRIPKKYFPDGEHLKPGMPTVLHTKEGQRRVTVKKVGQSVIDVDLNHPMAGKTLDFAIEIVAIRAASEEELAHGHVHGPGGHSH